MAVSCSVHGAPRRGLTGSIVGDDKGKLKVKNQLVYRVKVDDPDEAKDCTYFDAITASGLPIVNLSVYSIGNLWIPYSICRSKSAKQDQANIRYWDVTCDFESPKSEGGEQDHQPQEKPESVDDVQPKIEYSSETIEVVAWKDIDGNEILNPVGEHFAEPTMRPVTLVVANLTFYAETFAWSNIADHGSHANAGPWNGKPRYSWLITDVNRSPAKIPIAGDPGDPEAEPPVPPTPDSELEVVQVSYTVKYNPLEHGWRESKILNGTKFRSAVGAAPQIYMDDKNDMPTTGFLDADGLKSETAVYGEWEHIPTLNFSTALKLPS
ncbi:hypothetical protein [Rosistilla oblonga]|uniref:Uncharacterized protein n=1 Tax=Rosistilla oblonga TaxID=2527990 RepID=A0A518ITY5_9BACT|nr:hypothetical protein [Rosistilla oblonga]QDV56520.1 hypothetical protein Mal33_25110 [Rosistilla oblonga]